MHNQILSLQAGRISQLSGRNVLKAGSSVYVKVIADKGNGQYLGSVAGNRVNITSSKGLQVGSSFVATINSKDGVIYITPKELPSQVPGQPTIQVQPLQPGQLANILSALGVPTTELSGNILKMFMTTQMKVDGQVVRSLYAMALKHKGKEKAAGEILTMLKDKGIEATEEELEELLDYLDGAAWQENDQGEGDGPEGKWNKGKELLNRSNKVGEGWVVIPYNLVETGNRGPGGLEKGQGNGRGPGEPKPIAAGIIRILFDKSNILKKINLNCYFDSKEYIFSLRFENKKCRQIDFNINPLESSEEKIVEKLKSFIKDKNVEINWSSPDLIEGFGSQGEEIISFQGEV